jgi:hypothetical protein
MATPSVYNYGLDQLATWASGGYKMLLISDASFVTAKSNQYVSALSGSEVTAVSYERATLISGTRTVDNTNNLIRYDANDPSFGSPVSGETVYGMVAFKSGTSDADSTLIAYYPFTTPVPTASSTFTVTLSSDGLIYTTQG